MMTAQTLAAFGGLIKITVRKEANASGKVC